MIKFGPSGRDSSMSLIATIDIPKYLKEMNLELFEYSFGRGINMSNDLAIKLNQELIKNDIEISIHAPYFINFATFDEEKALNNNKFIFDSLGKLKILGCNRCVFHPGSLTKNTHEKAMDKLLYRINNLIEEKYKLNYEEYYLCAETMGKLGQLGTTQDIIQICNLDKNIIPCIDFGHVNARENGKFYTRHDYIDYFSEFIDGVGIEKINIAHVHFSKIQYSQSGEVRHLTFDDEIFGPPFEPFIEAVIELNLNPHIICESAGTQLKDVLQMKDYYLESSRNV